MRKLPPVSKEIEHIFDFEELSKRTLGRDWKKMSAEQQTEFVKLFKQLLQGVYADRLLAYSDQKVVFEKEIMLKKGSAEVQSYLQTSDGKKIPLFYRLTDKSGTLEGIRRHHRRGQYGEKLPHPVQRHSCQRFPR